MFGHWAKQGLRQDGQYRDDAESCRRGTYLDTSHGRAHAVFELDV